MKQNGRLT